MGERVKIWTVHLDHGVPTLVHTTAVVSEKRVILDKYDSRFGRRQQYGRGDAETMGIGSRTRAPDHWFNRQKALLHWHKTLTRNLAYHQREARRLKKLLGTPVRS